MTPVDDDVALYRALSERVFALYARDEHRAALEVVRSAPAALAPWRAELAHLQACLHGRLGEHDSALGALLEAERGGGWWSPAALVEDDDLAALHDLAGWPSLVERSTAAWKSANARLDRSGDRLALPDAPARRLVVALHGAEQDARDAERDWAGAVATGDAVLAVRSSQRTSPRYRSWPDQAVAEQEVTEALRLLPPSVAELPVVAAGFSAGGRVALLWALSQRAAAVTGVVAVAPALSVDQLPAGPRPALRPASLVVGSEDHLAADVQALHEVLAPAGFALDVVDGLGHEVPHDVADRLGARSAAS